MKKDKITIKENANETGVLPEFIAGIPTAKHRSKERMALIRSYYQSLWKRLQKEKGAYTVYNDYLGVDVYIIEKESDKKTVNAASKNWQSTYAVKYLYKVIKDACCDDNSTIFFKPKEGTQTKNRYKNIAVLFYDFKSPKFDYLNFKVKLTIGIRSDNKHIQYCVNKIEVKKEKPTVQSVTN